MKFKFNLQFFGSSRTRTTQVRTRDPEPSELTELRNNIAGKINQGLETYDPNTWRNVLTNTYTNAQAQSNAALAQQDKLLSELPSSMNRNDAIVNEMLGATRSGKLPSGLTNAMNSSVDKSLQGSMGEMLNNLANRGVINSSIASQGISRLGQQAADAYNANYLNAYNAVNSQYANALQGSQSNTGALLSSIGTLGQQAMQPYQQAAALNSLNPNSPTAGLSPALEFWKGWQNSYDSRQDYDTIVRQGK